MLILLSSFVPFICSINLLYYTLFLATWLFYDRYTSTPTETGGRSWNTRLGSSGSRSPRVSGRSSDLESSPLALPWCLSFWILSCPIEIVETADVNAALTEKKTRSRDRQDQDEGSCWRADKWFFLKKHCQFFVFFHATNKTIITWADGRQEEW